MRLLLLCMTMYVSTLSDNCLTSQMPYALFTNVSAFFSGLNDNKYEIVELSDLSFRKDLLWLWLLLGIGGGAILILLIVVVAMLSGGSTDHGAYSEY